MAAQLRRAFTFDPADPAFIEDPYSTYARLREAARVVYDQRKFRDPDRFEVARNASDHVSFGGGIHFCVGAPLGRLELESSLRVLATHCRTLQLIEEPKRQPTFQFRAYQAVRFALR
jgi:cytochrome P450